MTHDVLTARNLRARALQTLSVVALLTVAARGQNPLPSAKELVAKHVTAIGGTTAYKAINSMRVRGKFDMAAQGLSGEFEILQTRPNKMLQKIEVGAIGHAETGYDGKVGWSIDPQSGPAVLSGRQLNELIDDAWFDGTLHEADHIKELSVLERTEYDKRPAFKVRVVYTSGLDETEYFDAEQGWAIGSEARRDTPLGVLPTTTWLRDYKKFGNLMFPTTIVQRVLGVEQALHITSCEFDVVPANAYDLPAPIKALIK